MCPAEAHGVSFILDKLRPMKELEHPPMYHRRSLPNRLGGRVLGVAIILTFEQYSYDRSHSPISLLIPLF